MVILIFLMFFLLCNALVFAGAWHWANACSDGKTSRFLFVLLWAMLGLGTAAFGIAGAGGFLNVKGFGITAWAIGGIVLAFCCRKKRKFHLDLPQIPLAERLGTAGVAALWFSLVIPAITERMGTDTALYHLYYPAMWIAKGEIYPVSIAGLPHEYFPIYGEMAYGWLMMPYADVSLTGLLQPLVLLAALAGMKMLADTLKISGIPALLAGMFLLSQGMVAINASLCYTDVLVGALLLSGAVLAISGSRGNGSWKTAAAAGTMLGAACGVKYSGLVAVPIIAAALFFYFIREKQLRKYAWVMICTAFFWGALACLGNFLRTGNPFYPVKIGTLFPQGIAFHRPAICRMESLLAFLMPQGEVMKLTTVSLLVYALLLIGFPLWFFIERKRQNGSHPDSVWLLWWGVTCVILLVHYFFYPSMAGVRQLIPALMLLNALWLPVLQTRKTPQEWGVFGLILLFALLERLNTPVFLMRIGFFMLLILCFIAAYFLSKKGLTIFLCGVCCVILASIPFISTYQMRCFFGTGGELLSGKARSEAVKIVIDRMMERPSRIAAVCTWNNFHFLNYMEENELFYVPIGKADTTHPHEVRDWRELREPTVTPAEWIARLHRAKADFLAIDFDSHQDFLNNPDWEFKTALAHPETFELLVHRDGFAFFRIK